MNANFNIERQAAVQAERTRLAAELHLNSLSAWAVPHFAAGPLERGEDGKAARLAHPIARFVPWGLTSTRSLAGSKSGGRE